MLFCEIGLNSDRSVLTSLRSSLHTGIIFLFFEYIFAKFVISAPGWSLSIVFCLIEIEDDLAVKAGCRHSRGSPSWPFLWVFFCIFCSHSPLGEWSAVQLPAKASDGHSASAFFLAAQLPATASDGLSSSVFLFYLSGYLTCCFLTPRQADIYGIFCSAEIFTTSLHQGRELFVHLLFHFFFAEMTFLAAHAGGHPSGCPHRAGLILSKKKKKKKKREKKGTTQV